MSRRTFTHKKRKSASASSAELEEDVGMELQNLRTRVEQLELRETALAQHINCEGVTDMMVTGERRRLVILLYQGNYSASMVQLREHNAILVEVLRAQLANKQGSTEQSIRKEQQHIDGILLDMVRAHNIHKVPVLSAAFSLLGECNHVAREYHDIVARYHRGAALSETSVGARVPGGGARLAAGADRDHDRGRRYHGLRQPLDEGRLLLLLLGRRDRLHA